MAASNSWLRGQRKSDLVELAESVGLQNYESFKKPELTDALDEFIAGNQARFLSNPELTGYFNSRSKALGSPVKREPRSDEGLKVTRRRQTKLAEEITPETDDSESPHARIATTTAIASSTTPSSALVQTPARGLAEVASRINLPATPADVAMAVDRSTLIIRQRVSSVYQESGFTEASHATRDVLSTVTSVIFCVACFELWFIRQEILSSSHAFTIPAIDALQTSDYPVYLPDMFLVVTSSFWSPFLTWALTSFIIPCFCGYFFNLNATSSPPPTRGRPKSHAADYVVDPLSFSIAKALLSYVVYAQGATFNGLFSELSIERLNNAVYGGYKGILVGTAITGLVSIYDAVLRK